MSIEELINKWERIQSYSSGFGQYFKIDYECIPDLCLGFSPNEKRCLILELPPRAYIPSVTEDMKFLTLSYQASFNGYMLELNENSFNDLFNELIISLLGKISKIDDNIKAGETFIDVFRKWKIFFANSPAPKISSKELKGFIAELIMLDHFIENQPDEEVDNIVDSWKGPYDETHDFTFPSHNTEVKSTEDEGNSISISSEYQLMKPDEKGLELAVVLFKSNSAKGLTLEKLVLKIRENIRRRKGDIIPFVERLFRKGLHLDNLVLYEEYRYEPLEIKFYDCCDQEFPRLAFGQIPPEISSLKYKLNLFSLDKFVIQKTALNYGNI
ncbi:MAG: PD-(D/E)XK motif protein [Bacteroidia bacterium]|nr:PD-(D/E)XK motif protein [Bacteroidia bacterium]